MILYRPVGLQELELIYDSGMKAFPVGLPQQPVFYPVLDLDYARKVASDWNVNSGQFAGYITQFKVEDDYISQFEEHQVGNSVHQEFWIPAEEMEKFNQHIVGHIKVVEAHFGNGFQGFIPDKFGLQGKGAVEQFTLLANSYVYKPMDFYLEVKRNHKAVFLNYPFWQTYDFKNPGLKEKIIKAIKEAWLSAFPKIPLPLPPPVQEDAPLVNQTGKHTQSLVDSIQEDTRPIAQAGPDPLANSLDEDTTFVEQTVSPSLAKPEDSTLEEQTDSDDRISPVHEKVPLVKQSYARSLVNPLDEKVTRVKPIVSHFSRGLELGLSGKLHEAIDELSKAVEDDPDHVSAHTSLGVAFHRLGEEDRAMSCYEAALQIDRRHAEAHYFRANILYHSGNVREAISGYTIAIGLEPELIEAHQKPAPQDRLTDYSPAPAEMYRITRPAHRIIDLNKALKSNPGQANVFKERAAEYSRLWNYERAIADYTSSLAIQPDDAGALHARGLAYEQLGQLDRALEDYERAVALNPQLLDVFINRGIAFGQMGNFRQSIASLTEAIRLAPRNPAGYFNRGTSYFQLGDLANAIADFSTVIQLSPDDDAAYYWRGISNEGAGRLGEAIADYRQFLELSQDENARAEIEQRLNQWNEGDQNGVSGRSVSPNDSQKTGAVQSGKRGQKPDLYELITVLGERALLSTWFGSNVNCYGENAEQLHAYSDQNRPIEGHDFLQITSGIHQTMAGDFQAIDQGATSYWIFIRAWDGSGFYIETDDPHIEKQLKAHFQVVERVEGAYPPYEGLFIPI